MTVASAGSGSGGEVRAHAPGRVNLIGDHTDHAGGLALPMAIDLGTTVTGRRGGTTVRLTSSAEAGTAHVPLTGGDPRRAEPPWARYVAGVVSEVAPRIGFDGRVDTSLPVGAGLSSSASLELAVALALGFDGPALDLARLGRRAEQRASGVPCGLMDQLTSACGVAGHALLVDFTAESFTPVPVPEHADVVVVHSGVARALAGSPYAERQAQCRAAADVIGPLAEASTADVAAVPDPVVRRRARHVVTENDRVRAMAAALAAGDLTTAGRAMLESHASLRDDFEVSVPALDRAVEALMAVPGVVGARLTGAGFGGCVVALAERDALADPASLTGRGWRVRASDGARVEGWAPPGR